MKKKFKNILLFSKRISGLKFNAIDNYLNIGNLGGLGSSLANGFYCEFDIITTQATKGYFGCRQNGTTNIISIDLNTDSSFNTSSGKICVHIVDSLTNQLIGATTSSTNFNNGKKHTIGIFVNISNSTIIISIDKAIQSITYNVQNTLSLFINLPQNFYVGGHNNAGTLLNPMACVIDNFKIGTLIKLFGYFPFNEGMGQKAADISGNNNVGLLVKGANDYPLWTSET